MNWICETIEKLQRYEEKKATVEKAEKELVQLEQDLASVQPGGEVAAGKRREELILTIREAKRWVNIVHSGMSVLDEAERLVLERFFVLPYEGSADRLCYDLGRRKSTVYRRRDAALRHLTLALYGVLDS